MDRVNGVSYYVEGEVREGDEGFIVKAQVGDGMVEACTNEVVCSVIVV